jgi:hypothetical protein
MSKALPGVRETLLVLISSQPVVALFNVFLQLVTFGYSVPIFARSIMFLVLKCNMYI